MIDVGDTVRCFDNDPFDPADLSPGNGPTSSEVGLLEVDKEYTVSEVLGSDHLKLAEVNSNGYFGTSRFKQVR